MLFTISVNTLQCHLLPDIFSSRRL